MDNNKDLMHMVVTRYVTPDDEVDEDMDGHDYSAIYIQSILICYTQSPGITSH